MTPERQRAKPATPEKYLWLRGNRYWFRYGVPVRFRAVESRKIIQKALATSDRREASVRAAKMRSDLHIHWESLEASHCGCQSKLAVRIPTELELQLAATETAYLRIQPKLDELWKSKELWTEEAYRASLEALIRTKDKYLRASATEPLTIWIKLADKQIMLRGWMLSTGEKAYDSFVQMIAEASIEVLSGHIAKCEGKFGHQPSSPIVQAGLKAKKELAEPGYELLDLFDRYAAQRLAEKRKRLDGINQDRKVIQGFAEFVGPKRCVRSITPAEVRDWRDTIAALPPSHTKSKVYAGLALRDAALKARATGAKPVSPTTVNKSLSTVSPFLAWCVTNAYADRNPCHGLFYDIQKGRNPRPPFDESQLKTIFNSPLFTGFLRDGKEHISGDRKADDWRYWIPLICLFTGARIGEIAQLWIDDVRTEDGIPYLYIRHDEARGQQTKSGHARPAPVHSHLQTLGFLEFVERQRNRSDKVDNMQLFPELSPNERGHIGAAPSRFWRDYLRRIGVKSGNDGFGAHSFRHTMADALRTAGYLDDEIEVALGHNQKTVTSGYGKLRQGTVKRVSSMIEDTKFHRYLNCLKTE